MNQSSSMACRRSYMILHLKAIPWALYSSYYIVLHRVICGGHICQCIKWRRPEPRYLQQIRQHIRTAMFCKALYTKLKMF